ncbi:MAG: hypothetical protein ABS76_33570 [Pelagibacterium sp. SCN 64-44]|nr:MAG: hypothetical protein ABS76_33570 [Pelagibacterium sp. SCN 64-44]
MSYRIDTSRHVCTVACNHMVLAADRLFRGLSPSNNAVSADASPWSVEAPRAQRILLKGGTIVSMDRQVGDLARGDVLIDGEIIAAIGPDITADDAVVIDCADMIVLPGFCDPHIHSWEGALGRFMPNNMSTVDEDMGRPVKSYDQTRSYLSVMHKRLAPLYRPVDSYIGTLVTLLAALNGGITTVGDNAHNSRSAEHSDASIAALFDSGVRGVHAYGRPLHGEWDMQYPNDAYRLKQTYFSSDDQLCTMRLYTLGRYEVDELRAVSKVRKDLDMWLTFDSGMETKPVEELYADGTFIGKETLNHGMFVPLEKRHVLADNGLQVNVCPRIESQFRFGNIPYQDWLDVGIKPGISNDNPATYAISMFQEMRSLYTFQRAKAHRDAIKQVEMPASLVTQRDMLEAATIRGAENLALGHKTGSLTPGKQADVILINTDNPELFPKNNVLATVVQGADIAHVDTVFVAGRIAKWRGQLVGIDFSRIRKELEKSQRHIYEATNWPHEITEFGD